jgi:hypothetical protein
MALSLAGTELFNLVQAGLGVFAYLAWDYLSWGGRTGLAGWLATSPLIGTRHWQRILDLLGPYGL